MQLGVPALLLIGHMEILIVVLVVVLLFGASRIPQLFRGMGEGVREFRKGFREDEDEKKGQGAPAP
jgi:sec-independent protein translocase protein TatA